MTEQLLDLAIATTGGRGLWDTLRGLKIDISIGGPIWATKGWPPDKTFDQVLTLDTASEHIVFSPFTRPDQQMVFDAAADSVTMQTLGGEPVETLAPARAAFKGMLRNSAWDACHLAYFLGTPAGTTSRPHSCSPTRGCGPAKPNTGAKPARTGGACRCASHPRSPRTILTRCSTSTRRDCNNTVNLNLPSITLDIHDVELVHSRDEQGHR